MAVVISDASPLVHLSAIQRFDLLRQLYPVLLVPPAVLDEVSVAGKGRPGAAELQHAIKIGNIQVRAPNLSIISRTELQNLDPGEAEALALALETTAELVLIDELRGRAIARSLGIRAVGTLGVLIEGKHKGLVHSLRHELLQLHLHSQLQLTPDLEKLVLRLAGEDHDQKH